MYKPAELEEFKSLLLALQSRLQGDVDQIRDEALDDRASGRESKSPTHLAELGSETYEQEFSLRVIENEEETLAEIEEALRRIEDGTFGTCQACAEEGRPTSKSLIPKTRLRALPYARNCIECERKREELEE